MALEPSIKVEDLTIVFGHEIILENYNFELRGPMLVQIIGPNGAGKTTLIKAILGLVKPNRGRIYIDEFDIEEHPEVLGRAVGYVPQLLPTRSGTYPITAWEYVESAYMFRAKRWPRIFPPDDVTRRVAEVLELVDLPRDAWFRNIWKLSGGERQRVLIARALVHDPHILILDEPFSAVDPAGKGELAKFIGELSKNKLILVTSHDPTLLLPFTKKIMIMNRRFYRIGDPSEVLRIDILRKIYRDSAIQIGFHIHIADHHIARV